MLEKIAKVRVSALNSEMVTQHPVCGCWSRDRFNVSQPLEASITNCEHKRYSITMF